MFDSWHSFSSLHNFYPFPWSLVQYFKLMNEMGTVGYVTVCAGRERNEKLVILVLFLCQCIFGFFFLWHLFPSWLLTLVRFPLSSRKWTVFTQFFSAEKSIYHLFTISTVVRTWTIIDKRSFSLTSSRQKTTQGRQPTPTMMKTEDWNETFRFDEEETELAHDAVEAYEHHEKSKYRHRCCLIMAFGWLLISKNDFAV